MSHKCTKTHISRSYVALDPRTRLKRDTKSLE